MAHIRELIILAAAAVMLIGCQQTQQKEDIKVNDFTKQKQDLLEQIDRKYENPDAHYKLGKLYMENGYYNQAEFEFNLTLQFKPNHYGAQAALVKTQALSGAKGKSEAAADFYLNKAAPSAEESFMLGSALEKQDLDEYSLKGYRQALRVAPTSAVVNRQIGYYYLKQNNNVLAEEYLRRSFMLDPYNAETAAALGRLGVIVQVPKTSTRTKNDKQVDSNLEKEIQNGES